MHLAFFLIAVILLVTLLITVYQRLSWIGADVKLTDYMCAIFKKNCIVFPWNYVTLCLEQDAINLSM